MSTGRFVWHDLITSDAAGAKAFYTELLGWSYTPWTGPEGEAAPPDAPPYDMVMAAGSQMPQGGIMAAQAGAPTHWLGHVSLPGVDEVAARAVAGGGRIYFGPNDIPGVGRNVVLGDPAGAAFSVITFAGEGMPAPGPGQPEGSFVWDELTTTDVEGAKTFYAAVTGWSAENWDGGDTPYAMFKAGDDNAGGLMARPDGMQAPPLWLGYVWVADAAATAARAKELGGAVHAGPFTVPTIGEIAIIGDPQGAALGIIQPDPAGMGAS